MWREMKEIVEKGRERKIKRKLKKSWESGGEKRSS